MDEVVPPAPPELPRTKLWIGRCPKCPYVCLSRTEYALVLAEQDHATVCPGRLVQ